MAATALSVVVLPAPWSVTPANLVFTAGDNVNGNSFPCDGLTFLLVQNTALATATISIASVADADAGRTGDISGDTIAAAASGTVFAYRMYQLFPINGWRTPGSTIVITVSAATVKLAACRIAAGAGFFGAT